MTRLGAGRRGLDSRQGQRRDDLVFAASSRQALGPTQTPIQWAPRARSPGVNRPGRESDHPLPYSAEVRNAWSYTTTPPNSGVQFKKKHWNTGKSAAKISAPQTQFQLRVRCEATGQIIFQITVTLES